MTLMACKENYLISRPNVHCKKKYDYYFTHEYFTAFIPPFWKDWKD